MSEAKHSTLLSCPFCESRPGLVEIEPHAHNLTKFMADHSGSAYIECGCGAGLIDVDAEAAIKRWNTRAATLLHHELVAALEKIGGDREYSAADIASHAQKPHKTIDESVAEDALASIPAAPEAAPTPDLTDPNVVHANMLRGTIAKPTWEQIKHLYPEQAAAPTREEPTAEAIREILRAHIFASRHYEIRGLDEAANAILALKAAPAK